MILHWGGKLQEVKEFHEWRRLDEVLELIDTR
jgi:hypothetical protein